MPSVPTLNLLKIKSGEHLMIGRLFSPGGEGPHPAVVLFHGFPGVQQNHDVAMKLQKGGFHVLVVNYRGAWGSQGSFSFAHAVEDAKAAVACIRQPDVAAEHRIDLNRIAVAGHSMGGFLSVLTAADDPEIRACASVSGFNFGLVPSLADGHPEAEAAFAAMMEESCFFLQDATGRLLVDQVVQNQQEWNLLNQVHRIQNRPLLLVGAALDEVGPVSVHHEPLVKAAEAAGVSPLEHRIVDTDHDYVSAREEFASILLDFVKRSL